MQMALEAQTAIVKAYINAINGVETSDNNVQQSGNAMTDNMYGAPYTQGMQHAPDMQQSGNAMTNTMYGAPYTQGMQHAPHMQPSPDMQIMQ